MSAESAQRVVVFRVGGQRYGLDVRVVERVVRFSEPRALPLTTADIEGVTDHDGQLVPVIDLRRALGGGVGGPEAHARVLHTQVDGELLGFVVDQVLDVRACEPSEISPPPAAIERGSHRPVYTGTLRGGSELVLLVDPEALAAAARAASVVGA